MRIFPILLHPFCWAIPSIIMLKTYLIKIISFHYFSFSFHIFSIYYRTKRQNFVLSLCIVRIVCVSRVRKYLMRLWKNDDYYDFFVKIPSSKIFNFKHKNFVIAIYIDQYSFCRFLFESHSFFRIIHWNAFDIHPIQFIQSYPFQIKFLRNKNFFLTQIYVDFMKNFTSKLIQSNFFYLFYNFASMSLKKSNEN